MLHHPTELDGVNEFDGVNDSCSTHRHNSHLILPATVVAFDFDTKSKILPSDSMQPFQYTLPDGATVTGISSIPSPRTGEATRTPLVVGIHGGGYNSDYFHADSKHTAAIPSQLYGVPFVAFDRPYYAGTRPSQPVPAAADYPKETGTYVHRYILPTLWSEYGAGCSGIILLCHSLGSQQGIVAAALHTGETDPAYPLLALVASGFGHRSSPIFASLPLMKANHGPDHFLQSTEMKDRSMFRPGTVDAEVLKQSERLNHPIPVAEANSTRLVWAASWRDEWAARVKVPVMFAWAELDFFFEGTQEHLRECVEAFRSSPRVDGSWVQGAPHCMELSYWSQGWYARCFGFALECAAAASVKGVS